MVDFAVVVAFIIVVVDIISFVCGVEVGFNFVVSFVVTVAVVAFSMVFALAIFVINIIFFVGGVEIRFDVFPLSP